ncbi:MAG: type II toxin-antitoxin system RelE/ParE family toxin [Micropepsaceae bacterium]
MKIYLNAWFAKFARKEKISDAALCEAMSRIKRGSIDADLGGGLIKQRVARAGAGKSGGFRTLIFFRQGARAVFVYGFAKSAQANLDAGEVAMFKKAAKIVLALSQDQIDVEVETGRLTELNCGDQEI